jgi:hypothetical protein
MVLKVASRRRELRQKTLLAQGRLHPLRVVAERSDDHSRHFAGIPRDDAKRLPAPQREQHILTITATPTSRTKNNLLH